MAFDAQKIINSPFGLKFAYLLGKTTPNWLGHRIAIFLADYISSHRTWKFVQTTRCNQWVVHGRKPVNHDLDQLVRENFRSIAISIFDFYSTLNNSTASLRLIEPHPFAIQLAQRPEFTERGLILAALHMSNFDLAFQLGGKAGVKAMALTLPDLNPAYQKQLELRNKSGVGKVLPASVGSIKLSIDHLRAGGLVLTAIDRPVEKSIYRPLFFGLPAPLPIHHIFMALKANVPIIVAGVFRNVDGKYHFLFSDPIEMQPHPDRHEEILQNAEKVLHVCEDFIRRDSSQWSMTFPVWPEALEQMPG